MGFYEERKKELLVRLYRYFVKNGVFDVNLNSTDDKVSFVNEYLESLEECYNGYLEDKISLSKLLSRFYNYEVDKNIKIEDLDDWMRYFVSEESRDIPMWVKVYSIQWGINKTTDFKKLSFNPLIFRKSIEFIERYFGVEKYRIDNFLEGDALSGEVMEVYSRLESMFSGILNNSSPEGKWIKYEHHDEGSMHKNDPDYLRMYNSICGKRTEWSIGSSERTAENELLEGPIYVYYIKGEEGEFNVPKLLIRINKNNGKVLGLSGVLPGKSIELQFGDVLEEKLRSLSFYDDYSSFIRQLRTLVVISDKTFKNIELTKDELKFLYKLGEEFQFYIMDSPCLACVLTIRNKGKDIATIFDCKEDEVSFSLKDLNSDVKVLCSDVRIDDKYPDEPPQILIGSITGNFTGLDKDIMFPSEMYGNVKLAFNTRDLGVNIKFPKNLYGYFGWDQQRIDSNVTFPNYISGHFYMNYLSIGDNIVFPEKIDGGMCMASVKSLNGAVLPKRIGGNLLLNSLESLIGVVLPDFVGGYIEIYEKRYSLEEVKRMQSGEEKGGRSVPAGDGSLIKSRRPSGFINITLMLISVFLFGILSFVITLLILK